MIKYQEKVHVTLINVNVMQIIIKMSLYSFSPVLLSKRRRRRCSGLLHAGTFSSSHIG